MQGRADAGAGVKGIDKGHQRRQDVVALKHLGPQILPTGIQHIAGHGDHLGDDDIGLNSFKVLHIEEQRIGQRTEHQQIPADVKNHKKFVKGNQIVECAVNGMAALGRDQVLGDEVHHEVEYPAQQKLHMGKARFVQPAQGKPAVINRFFLHARLPREEYFSGKSALRHWDRAPRYVRAAPRRFR